MKLPFNLTETINSRYSMRTFSSQEVNEETIKKLGGMINYSEDGDMFTVQIILPMKI